jgi:hypothetical protein
MKDYHIELKRVEEDDLKGRVSDYRISLQTEFEEVLNEIIKRPQWLGQSIAAKYLRGEDWRSYSEEGT